jgi:hypothetical protein
MATFAMRLWPGDGKEPISWPYIADDEVVVVVVVVMAPADALSDAAISDMAPPVSAGAISEVVVSLVVVVSLDLEQALAPRHKAAAASGRSILVEILIMVPLLHKQVKRDYGQAEIEKLCGCLPLLIKKR